MAEKEQVDRSEGRRQLLTALITAGATVVVAIISLFGTLYATGRSITSDAAPQSGTTVTVTSTVAAPAPRTSDRSTSTSTSIPPAESGGPEVRNHAALRVVNHLKTGSGGTNQADLDATDKQWGADGKSGDGKQEGFYFSSASGDSLWSGASGEYSVLDQGVGGDFASCEGAAAYQNGFTELPIGDLLTGRVVCVRTTGGRYAALTVKQEATPERVDFDVTVWERKGN